MPSPVRGRVLVRVEDVTGAAPDPAAPPRERVGADDLALLIYTSGTTGNPKGVMLTHGNLVAMTASFIEWFGMGPRDHSLLVLPLFHANGIVLGTLSALRAGGQVTITGRFSRERFFADVERLRPTYFSAVPAIYALLSALPDDVVPDTSSLRFAVCGAAPMPAELIDASRIASTSRSWRDTACPRRRQRRRSTRSAGPRKPGTVGLPLPGQRVAVVDEAGEPVPQGETGEVVIAGPVVMAGYLGRPEETARDHRGWMAAHRRHRPIRRRRLSVNRRPHQRHDHQRWRERVPERDRECPVRARGVLEAAVVGFAGRCARRGPAWPSSRSAPALGVSEAQLLVLCAQRLAPYKRPVGMQFLDELPKNPVGKIDKRRLRAMAVEA